MIKGFLRVLDTEQMERLHGAVLDVLEKTGLRIEGEFLLRALADAGCRVDFASHRAWFKPDVVERQVASQRDRYRMVRSSLWYPFCRCLPEDDVALPEEFVVDYGYATPWIYDYREGRYRKPTVRDQIDMIRLGNALPSVKAVNAPLICSEFDRTYCDHNAPAPCTDERVLGQADDAWRLLVAAQKPIELESGRARELARIVESARRELLA